MGMVALADWWLTMGFAPEGVMAAAAAPARTAVKAKKRMAVFILVSSAEMGWRENKMFSSRCMLEHNCEVSPVFS
jgi:hypothetical protein